MVEKYMLIDVKIIQLDESAFCFEFFNFSKKIYISSIGTSKKQSLSSQSKGSKIYDPFVVFHLPCKKADIFKTLLKVN